MCAGAHQVERLLEQYGGMVVELEEAAALEARQADAAAWVAEAQPILDADAPATDAHTAALEVRPALCCECGCVTQCSNGGGPWSNKTTSCE